jgi:hypothetical protein
MLVASAGAFAQSTPTIAINVVGKSTVANTAPYGTVVDAFQARTASGTLVPLITWSVDNPDFYTDPLGDLHTNWNSIIMPGTQAMMITASAPGYVTATESLTVTVTGTLAPQPSTSTTPSSTGSSPTSTATSSTPSPSTSTTASSGSTTQTSVANSITMTNASAGAISNYPYQFGRPFVDGAIADQPQVLINGQPVATQADVKNRYPDGSVEFAVIAVVIPALPASGSLTPTFQNQSAGNNTPLTQVQMLSSTYNFDASMTLTPVGGAAQAASARTMLQNGNYEVWTSGPVAQTSCSATTPPRANTTLALATATIRSGRAFMRPSGRRRIRSLSEPSARTG